MEGSNTKRSKSELKRQALLKGAARVFSEKGYVNTSIKNITDEASVAVGTFYIYFKNKEEVLEQIYEEILNISLKSALKSCADKDNNPAVKFICALTGTIYSYAVNKDLSKILLVKSMGINESFENKRWEVLDKISLYLKDILKHLNKEHSIEIYDVDIYSVLLSQSILGVMSYWIDDRIESDLKEIIFSLCIYHLKALNIDFTFNQINTCINEILPDNYQEFIK